jgi:putative ABC transport system ATP-binding protein
MAIYALADADLEVEDRDAFWVAPGAVLIGNRNLADLHLHLLRDGIAIVENSGVLERSIEDNLSLGDTTITRTAMRDILEVVHLDSVVNGLPDGIETELGAFGYPLSRSETIRLKIAAALLARPRVLVVTQVFDSLAHHHRRAIIEHIAQDTALTFINFSNRRDIAAYGEFLFIEPDTHHRLGSVADLLAYERRLGTSDTVPGQD